MPTSRYIALLTAGVVATFLAMCALTWWRHASRDAAARASIAAAMPFTADENVPAVHVRMPPHSASPAARLPAAAESALAARIERLLATRAPADAFKAYHLILDCATFNRQHDRVIFDPDTTGQRHDDIVPGIRLMTGTEKRRDTAMCAGLTERERLSRLDYLAIAARAGVPDAAISFAQEGPFGDPTALTTRPDDPLVKSWKALAQTLLARAAADADVGALGYLAAQQMNGSEVVDKDPALAYRHAAALGMIYADGLGPDHTMAKAFSNRIAPSMAARAGLTPDQLAMETVAARAIADRDRAQRVRH